MATFAAIDHGEMEMDDVIVELKRERDELRDRLKKIDAAIEEYERWAESVAGLVRGGKRPPVNDRCVDAGDEPTPIGKFEEEVRALFGRVSRPQKRTEVHDALSEAGIVVGGKNPLNTVASRLSRMEGITNLKGHGYWAEDRPYPPAGHGGAAASDADLFDGGNTGRSENGSPAASGEHVSKEAE